MARSRSPRMNRSALDNYLSRLGSPAETLESEGVTNMGVLLAGLGGAVATRPSITGIDSVDKMLYDVKDSLEDFKTATTVTTISSIAAALCGVLLLIRTRK